MDEEIQEVTWTNLSVIKLIEEYKKRPQLWDTNHEHYRVLSVKYDSWQELADMFDCNIGCIRKKLNSLFASHRREKAKVKYGGKSTWFLYSYMSFLPTHIDDPSSTLTAIVIDNDNDQQKNQIQEEYITSYDQNEEESLDTEYLEEEDNLQNPVIQEIYVKEEPPEPQPKPASPVRYIRKVQGNTRHSKPRIKITKKAILHSSHTNTSNNLSSNHTNTDTSSHLTPNNAALSKILDCRLSETIKLLRKSDIGKRKDECDSFGEYIATSLRKHDERTQCMIKQAINNILFEQEMKKYGNNQQFTVVLTNMDDNPLLMETGESITGNK